MRSEEDCDPEDKAKLETGKNREENRISDEYCECRCCTAGQAEGIVC